MVLRFIMAAAIFGAVGCATQRVDSLITFRETSYPGSTEFVRDALPRLLMQHFEFAQAPLSGLPQNSEVWILQGKVGTEYVSIRITALKYEGRLSVMIDSPVLSPKSKQITDIRAFIVQVAGNFTVSIAHTRFLIPPNQAPEPTGLLARGSS
jgi:hypothetical protein